MADLISDGMTRVSWVPSIANINAPTAGELTAGNDWTARLTPDGLKTDPTTASVDTSSLASTFNTSTVGRRSYDIELTFKRGSTPQEDQPYTTLLYGTSGNLVVRRGVPCAQAYATNDEVEVYPVIAGERQNVAPAANEILKFTTKFEMTQPAVTSATVA